VVLFGPASMMLVGATLAQALVVSFQNCCSVLISSDNFMLMAVCVFLQTF